MGDGGEEGEGVGVGGELGRTGWATIPPPQSPPLPSSPSPPPTSPAQFFDPKGAWLKGLNADRIVLLDCCGPKSKAPETALARRDHLVESLGLPVTDQSRLATSVSSLSPLLDLEDREIGVFKAKAKSAKGAKSAKSAGKDKSKVSGRAGRESGAAYQGCWFDDDI